jgi:hypothetical protein
MAVPFILEQDFMVYMLLLELLALLSLVVKDGLPLFCTILLLALLVLGVVSDIGILLMEYG